MWTRKNFEISSRTRNKPGRSQRASLAHIKLLEEFLLKERDGRSLEEATQEDLKAFVVWEKSSRPTIAQALVHGIRNYYRLFSKETMVKAVA